MSTPNRTPSNRYPKRHAGQVVRVRAHELSTAHDSLEAPLSRRVLQPVEDLPDLAQRTGGEKGWVKGYERFVRNWPEGGRGRKRVKEGKREREREGGREAKEEVFARGDTVFVEAEGSQKHHVGVITEIWSVEIEGEEEGEEGGEGEEDREGEGRKYARVHWFFRQDQLPKVKEKRAIEWNEIFYSCTSQCPALPLSAILGHCQVASSPHASTDHWDDEFVCYYALDKRARNYARIDWNVVRKKGLEEGEWEMHIPPPSERKAERGGKRKQREVEEESEGVSGDVYAPASGDSESEDAASGDEEEEEASPSEADTDASSRPRKARKSRTNSSPTKTPRKPRGQPSTKTPTSARRRGRQPRMSLLTPSKTRRRAVPIPSNTKWASSLPEDPWMRALATLHVSATPDDLPCREQEFESVLGKVEGLLEEGEGGCIYISGVPGTGKTATVHAVVRTLHARAQASEIPPFTFLEVNGLKLTGAREAYAELWRVVSGEEKRVSPGEALRRLVGYFERSGKRGPEAGCFVVLMDELDQLITTKQDVVYNFFNWPTLPSSRLVVLAVANTMDLPERVMAGKVRSRLGMERINFAPYTRDQLKEIVLSRLRGGILQAEELMHPDAVQIAAMRVAGVSGDARRILDISRRSLELARGSEGEFKTVTIGDVNAVMRQMQASPVATFLRECTYAEKVMLVAVVKVSRREGVPEVKWSDVAYQHLGLYATLADPAFQPAKPTVPELRMVLGALVAAKVLLLEEGVQAMRRGEAERKVQLGVESGEVERVLGEWGGGMWKNLLGVN